MELLITHTSALDYWRLCGAAPLNHDRRQRRRVAPSSPPDISLARQLNKLGLRYPIRAMVSKPQVRRTSRKLISSVSCGPLPEGCIVDVGGGLFVASPELCFFQMTRELSLAKLLELGLELCGSYALPVPGVNYGEAAIAERRLYGKDRLTDTSKLEAFLARTSGMYNQRYLPKILQRITDNSASPMETKLFVLLTLPYKLGGFGFEMPELNAKISPSKSAKKISTKKFF